MLLDLPKKLDSPFAEEYVADTLLHEIMHAALSVGGHQLHNEEEVVSALSSSMMLFLRDARNEPLIAKILPEGYAGGSTPNPTQEA